MAFEIEGGEWIGVVIIFLLFITLGFAIGYSVDGKQISLSQETADKICLDLTNESGVVARDWWDYASGKEPIERGELYCRLPSYDATHLIKVGK